MQGVSIPGAWEEDNCLTQRCYEKTAVITILCGMEEYNLEFKFAFFCMGNFYHFILIWSYKVWIPNISI